MSHIVRRSTAEPPRSGLTWLEVWRGEDRALIKCWENGRALSLTQPELAKAAMRGELPPLIWKGGITGNPKMKKKYGSLQYLATWQGLQGNELDIDVERETTVTCARTGVLVTFTSDLARLDADAGPEETSESTVM
jgi:hypothetical protein